MIYGAQVMVSTEGITGTGIDLNKATGAAGASTTFQDFEGTPGGNPDAATDDNDVLKIANIGFITETTTTADADLNFTFSNVDADGDATATQTTEVTSKGATPLLEQRMQKAFKVTASDNSIAGSDGDDILVGGAGIDSLTGGAGADHFRYNATSEGLDGIVDFTLGTDVLDFKSSAFGNLAIGTLSAANFSPMQQDHRRLLGPSLSTIQHRTFSRTMRTEQEPQRLSRWRTLRTTCRWQLRIFR